MRTDPEFDEALRAMVEAWDRAERSPRDVQLRRRAMEQTAILVTIARRVLDDAEATADPSDTHP